MAEHKDDVDRLIRESLDALDHTLDNRIEASSNSTDDVLLKLTDLEDAVRKCENILAHFDEHRSPTNVLIQLSRGLESEDQHVAFCACKVLVTTVSSPINKNDTPSTHLFHDFFSHMVSNLLLDTHQHLPETQRINAIIYSLGFLHETLKQFRKQIKHGLQREADSRILQLLVAIARKSPNGGVLWISKLFSDRRFIPSKALSHYILLLHSIVKTHTLITAAQPPPVDKDALEQTALLVRYIKAHIPSLGVLLEDCTHDVRRKTLSLLAALTLQADVASIIMALDYLYRCLDHMHIPSFIQWWNRTITDDYTEFYLDDSIPIDRESLKISVHIVLNALDMCIRRYKGSTGMMMERKRFLMSLEKYSSGFSALLCNPHLPDYMFQLYGDNDAQLFNILSMLLQIYVAAEHDEALLNILPSLSRALRTCNPHLLWLRFLRESDCDIEVLLDFLISGETGFLEYLVKYLRYILSNVGQLNQVCAALHQQQQQQASRGDEGGGTMNGHVNGSGNNDTLNMLISIFATLANKVESLQVAGLFPYSPEVLVKRLNEVVTSLSKEGR